jgi:hypothetical protein
MDAMNAAPVTVPAFASKPGRRATLVPPSYTMVRDQEPVTVTEPLVWMQPTA